MIALIIGYGSAGRRHLKVLKKISYIKKIYIVTSQDKISTDKVIFLKKIKEINPKVIVIANETNKHKDTLLDLEKKFNNKIIIVEKPLFHKFYNFKCKNNKVFVAYNLRFHHILKFIKQKILSSKEKVFYVEAETSSYLPYWRKNRDYSKSYSSNKKKGGGTLLDLSHEIDYVKWLFKDFKIKKIFSKKISSLNITSNDFTLILGKLQNRGLIKLKMTYFNKLPKRILTICFDNGKQIYADLLKSNLKIFYKERVKSLHFKKSSHYLMTKEMYLDIFNKKYTNLCTYKEALNLLKSIKNKFFLIN